MTCDNCGRLLTDFANEFYAEQYQLQMLPLGETINGRRFITVCPEGRCLDLGEVAR